jgi:predicted nuclease with TOPRIM domain
MAVKRKITNSKELQTAITELEQKVRLQEINLKADFSETKENLRPQRVLKNTFSYLAETPEVQKILVNTVIGFILGYASKKAVELLNEETLNPTLQNIVNNQLSLIETKKPDSLLGRGISLFRKHTPAHSAMYPFLRYK